MHRPWLKNIIRLGLFGLLTLLIFFDGGFVLTDSYPPEGNKTLSGEVQGDNLGIYVINLDHRPDRLSKIQNLLIHLPWPVVRISAVNGKELPADTPHIDRDYCAQHLRRPLTQGAIGCSLSHIKVWQEFLASNNAYALVFEDDVQFDPSHVFKTISELIASSKLWDVVRFTYKENKKFIPIMSLPLNHDLVYFSSHASYTGSYLINRYAAKMLLDKVFPIKLPIDHYMFRSWELGLKTTAVTPPLMHQEGMGSDTVDIHTPQTSGTLVSKIHSRLSRWVFSIKKRVMTMGHALYLYIF